MEIKWLRRWPEALVTAKAAENLVLVDFYSPDCIGCQHMDMDTYSSREVQDYMNESLTALKQDPDSSRAEEFRVRWTPFLAVVTEQGETLQTSIGFLPPQELIPWLLLGWAKAHFVARAWTQALGDLERIISLHPKSHSAPEAVFLRGIAGYRESGDTRHLKRAYTKLSEEYANSAWFLRAQPYRNF